MGDADTQGVAALSLGWYELAPLGRQPAALRAEVGWVAATWPASRFPTAPRDGYPKRDVRFANRGPSEIPPGYLNWRAEGAEPGHGRTDGLAKRGAIKVKSFGCTTEVTMK